MKIGSFAVSLYTNTLTDTCKSKCSLRDQFMIPENMVWKK